MAEYIDKNYLAVDRCLITYNGNDETLIVPTKFEIMEITEIGAGAFSESENLKECIIPPQIKKIEENAFSSCKELKYVCFSGDAMCTDMPFFNCVNLRECVVENIRCSEQEYLNLRMNGIVAADNKVIMSEYPEIMKKNGMLHLTARNAPAAIPNDIPGLFVSGQEMRCGDKILYENCDYIAIEPADEKVWEDRGVKRLIEQGLTGRVYENVLDGYSERHSETLLFVCVMDDTATIHSGSEVFITVKIKFGRFFFQDISEVRCGGKQYYIYTRYYLADNGKYRSQDVGIYDKNGRLVTDYNEVMKVYEKYKFISMLK